ncbi:uncharacterized protein LOC104266546 [Ciona intestinalis]
MRAGVAASRKLKPKDNSNNKPQQQRSTSKTRRQNSQNVESSKDDQVGTGVNHQRARKKVSTPQQSIKNEYCVTTNSSISNLTTNCERDSLLRPHSNTGNGSVKTGVLASESLRQSLSQDCAKQRSSAAVDSSNSEKSALDERKSLTVKVACSADAFVAAGAAAKGGERLAQAKRTYYRKAIALMVVGGVIFTLGIALAALYFAGYPTIQMAGPVCLSIGLLLGVCGIVWIPIIKTKLKRQQQVMTRTFSL